MKNSRISIFVIGIFILAIIGICYMNSTYKYQISQHDQIYYTNSYVLDSNGCITFEWAGGNTLICGSYTIKQLNK